MRKIMIGLLAFALIACGVVAITAVADEETDAADGRVEYSKVFRSNDPETVDISTNESAFTIDPRIGTFEVKWTYQDAADAWQTLTYETDFTIGDWKYSLKNNGDGQYTLTIDTDETSATAILHLKYKLVLKPIDGAETETGAMEVVVNISKNGSVLPDHVTANTYFFNVDTAIDRATGKIVAYDATDAEVDVSKYRWFAYTLPAGVSISADGYLSGIPRTATVGDAIQYEIYAEDSFGNIGKYTVGISVLPRSEDLVAYYVHRGTTDSFNSATEHPRPKVSAVQKDDEAYLVVAKNVLSANIKVTVVGGDQTSGYKQELAIAHEDANFKFYKLPTALTGAYGIIMETTLNITNSTLYVLPQVDVVVAGIGVSSSSNANNGGGN